LDTIAPEQVAWLPATRRRPLRDAKIFDEGVSWRHLPGLLRSLVPPHEREHLRHRLALGVDGGQRPRAGQRVAGEEALISVSAANNEFS
jgi:hypothetical protein